MQKPGTRHRMPIYLCIFFFFFSIFCCCCFFFFFFCFKYSIRFFAPSFVPPACEPRALNKTGFKCSRDCIFVCGSFDNALSIAQSAENIFASLNFFFCAIAGALCALASLPASSSREWVHSLQHSIQFDHSPVCWFPAFSLAVRREWRIISNWSDQLWFVNHFLGKKKIILGISLIKLIERERRQRPLGLAYDLFNPILTSTCLALPLKFCYAAHLMINKQPQFAKTKINFFRNPRPLERTRE